MKLSLQTKTFIEDFFRHYFDDENLSLPEIQIYSGRGASMIIRILNVDGITFGRHILIRPGLFYRNPNNLLCISKKLLVHEIAHTLQYQKQGVFGFLISYFKEYLNGIRHRKKYDDLSRMYAYLNIPHEIEARAIASEFISWFNLQKN